jgi:hypothetical protein
MFMNSLATLLASLLASAHGFGATPVKDKEDCFRDGVNEKFFVYSTDNTQVFAVAEAVGGISIPLEVTHGVAYIVGVPPHVLDNESCTRSHRRVVV